MGQAWASGEGHMGGNTVYVHIILQLSKSKRRHSLGFGWKRARKSFWTSRASWCLQCNHVCMTSCLALNGTLLKEWELGSIGCCYLQFVLEHSYLNSLSSGVSTVNHLHWLVLLCCNVISRRVSTANFVCWLVLVCCNLQSLSSEFFRCQSASHSLQSRFSLLRGFVFLVSHTFPQ